MRLAEHDFDNDFFSSDNREVNKREGYEYLKIWG